MAPDDIGRIIIFGLCAGLFLLVPVVWYLGSHDQDSDRLVMWAGFWLLITGTAVRNALGVGWLPSWCEFPGIGCQITGLTCLMIAFVQFIRHRQALNHRARDLTELQADIDSEIGRNE